MSVKIAVIGDPHNKDDNMLETKELIYRLKEVLTRIQPDLIVVAGDMLHSFDVAHVAPFNMSIHMLKELKAISNVILIIGNHDLSSPTSYLSDSHFFTALREWSNLVVIDQMCGIFDVKGMKFAAVPYVTDGRFEEALHSNQEYKHDEITAIFAHQQFLGCKMDRVISKTGDKWSVEKPLVISGHIHEHQRLAENLIYVGTPRQSSFRDSTDKTISIFEFSRDTISKEASKETGISNGVNWVETRIPIGLPIKVKITIRVDQVYTWIPPTGHKIKLEITGTFSEIASIKEHPNILNWKTMGIVIVYADIQSAYVSPGYIQPPPHFTSFTSMYKKKIESNPDYIQLYDEIIEGKRGMDSMM